MHVITNRHTAERSGDRDVVVAALLALGYLCGSDSVCDDLLNHGFLKVLLKTQANTKVYDLQLAGVYVMYALVERMAVTQKCRKSDTASVVYTQLYNCALAALVNHPDCVDIQARATAVCTRILRIIQFTVSPEEAGEQELITVCDPQVFLESVHQAMRSHPGNVRVQTSGCLAWHQLCALYLAMAENETDRAANRTPSSFEHTLESGRAADALLDSIAMNKADTDVLKAMRRFPDKRHVQLIGCQFFSLLGSIPRLNTCAYTHDVHIALQKTMQWHPQDSRLHLSALRAVVAYASCRDGIPAESLRLEKLWVCALYKEVCAAIRCALDEVTNKRELGGSTAADPKLDGNSAHEQTIESAAAEVAVLLAPAMPWNLDGSMEGTIARIVVVIGCRLIGLLYTDDAVANTALPPMHAHADGKWAGGDTVSIDHRKIQSNKHGYIRGIQSMLLDVLDAFPGDLCVQWCAMDALCKFASNDANLVGMSSKTGMSARVVDLVLGMMQQHLQICDVQKLGCTLLMVAFRHEQFRSHQKASKEGVLSVGTAFRKANAHLTIQKAMRTHSQELELQNLACEALAGYCADENNVRKVGVSGLYLDVLSAMRDELDSERSSDNLGSGEDKCSYKLLWSACNVLGEFCANKDNNKSAGKADVHLLLLKAMAQHMEDGRLQLMACRTLAEYCRNEENNTKAGECRLHSVVQRTMEMHVNNEAVQEVACMVLCRYYRSSDNVREGQLDGALDDLERAAVHFPENVDIVTAYAVARKYTELLDPASLTSEPGDSVDDSKVLRHRIASKSAERGGEDTKHKGLKTAKSREFGAEDTEDEMEYMIWREQQDLISNTPKAKAKRAATLRNKRIKLLINACLALTALALVYGALWLITPGWVQRSLYVSLEYVGVIFTSSFLFYKKSREIYKTLLGGYGWVTGADEQSEPRRSYRGDSRMRP